MECYERGLLTMEDTGGIDLSWGNAAGMVEMLERMLTREGFGDTLAEGSYRAAAAIGNGAGHFFIGTKKQEMPAHMPHVKRSLALIYAVNPFGADHQSSEHDPNYEPDTFATDPDKIAKRMSDIGLTNPQDSLVLNEEKVRFALRSQYAFSAMDTANVCQFVFGPAWELLGMEELAHLTNLVTGWELTVDDLMVYGRRRLNMLRAFNAREGLTRDEDTLPRRLFDEPLVGGNSDGIFIDEAEFDSALDEYYRQAEWDPATGNPTRATLEELELGWVADLIGA
jgi:aldehyde:ferredoxin oxidoreductase